MKYIVLLVGVVVVVLALVWFGRGQSDELVAQTPKPERLVNVDVKLYTMIEQESILVGTISFDANASGSLTVINDAPRATELASAWATAIGLEKITYRGSGIGQDDTHYSFGYTAKKSDDNYSGALVRHMEDFGFLAKQ